MNPFDQKPIRLEACIMDWNELHPAPYQKNTVDPYTRTRVILMNGTEFEANWYLHQYSRHECDDDVRRELALIRRLEQQQQKFISLLKPPDETILEHTIGYEQLAVDLTAFLAQHEPDPYVRQVLDFALLEDFDHLYRYADLMDMETGTLAENLVGRYTEVMPGRPTISEHCYPFDTIKRHVDGKKASLQTQLNVGTITAAEQQTMNFYMNVCGAYQSECGRKLYQEIAMIEEQHVSEYGSLMDTTATWAEGLLLHQYTECYLYHSCMQTESDPRIKRIWAQLYEQETAHLHAAARILKKVEGKEYQEVVGAGDFPEPILLASNIDYVRGVLKNTVQNVTLRESYANVDDLVLDADFFNYQNHINRDLNAVESHAVIEEHIRRFGQDYRWESAPNPIEALRDRTRDNVDVGRVPSYANAGVKQRQEKQPAR